MGIWLIIAIVVGHFLSGFLAANIFYKNMLNYGKLDQSDHIGGFFLFILGYLGLTSAILANMENIIPFLFKHMFYYATLIPTVIGKRLVIKKWIYGSSRS